jgi:hypothetical protein
MKVREGASLHPTADEKGLGEIKEGEGSGFEVCAAKLKRSAEATNYGKGRGKGDC